MKKIIYKICIFIILYILLNIVKYNIGFEKTCIYFFALSLMFLITNND